VAATLGKADCLDGVVKALCLPQVNVTDIDDKIIKRARLNRLLEDFIAQVRAPACCAIHSTTLHSDSTAGTSIRPPSPPSRVD
jgi:hypothetical protein